MNEYEDMDALDGEPTAVVPVEPEPKVEPVVEEAPPAEVEAEEVEETPEQVEDRKKKTGSQRLKEKVHRMEIELETLRRGQTEPAKVAPPVNPGGPNPDDFGSHEEYSRASVRFEAEKLLAEREQNERINKASKEWESQAAKARAKYDDFDDALKSAQNPSNAVFAFMSESPVQAELAYHLASNPDEYDRINQLTLAQATRELTRIEDKLTEKPKPKSKTSQAPPPVVPVVASAGVSAPTYHAEFEEF